MIGTDAIRRFASPDELVAAAGTEVGVTAWSTIDQDMVDRFADATDDHQWIHVDAVRAADGPYGSTVAHGMLLLSLIPRFSQQVYSVDGIAARINYGFDRVRFVASVPAGSRVRDRIVVLGVERKGRDLILRTRHTLEIEGMDRPGFVAESITYLVSASAPDVTTTEAGSQ